MSDFTLEPKFALNTTTALSESWDGFSFAEITDLRFWWLTASQGNEAAISKLAEKHLGVALPDPGSSVIGKFKDDLVWIDWAGRGQWFVSSGLDDLPKAIAGKALITDQSDGWVGLTLEGKNTARVMEKLCALDMHRDVFGAGRCARVPIETMIALIACDDIDVPRYRLMFQRSSARSFVDHLRHAAYSTCGEKLI